MASPKHASLTGMFRLVALALVFGSSPLHAADIYIWTDSDGRKQISDVVPEKDRVRAKKVEAPAPSAAAGGTAAPIEPPVAPAPVASDCQTRWQRYLDSRECLAFYEYAQRGLQADPRASCAVVAAPAVQC
jgi:hypothetical protein